MFERSLFDNFLNMIGIICRNVYMFLRRQESSFFLEMFLGVVLEEGVYVLRCSFVILELGVNQIIFRIQVKEFGIYIFRQLCVLVGFVWFVFFYIYFIVQYDVYLQEFQLYVELLVDSFLVGIFQKVKFIVIIGYYIIKNGDSLQLSNVEVMFILCQVESRVMVYFNMREQFFDVVFWIQFFDKVMSISLFVVFVYYVIEFELEVFFLFLVLVFGGESDMLGMVEFYRKYKDKQKIGYCMVIIDYKVLIDCLWFIYFMVIVLIFSVFFRIMYVLLFLGIW